MNVRDHILAVGLACVAVSNTSAAELTVNDYCNPSVTAPAGIKEMRPLADGESFAALSDDGKSIDIFNYRNGRKIGTLFSIDGVKGDLKIDSFDGYVLSDNEKKILLWNNVNRIYRHSFTADYYVYDILRSTLAKVSNDGPQRGATMSHDGRMVAYQRDNNIYISNIDYKTDKAITTDGKVNEIIYGTPDWVYEEEFGIQNTMRWSGDDSTLAYMRFDESNVPVYSFDEYGTYSSRNPLGVMYPKEYAYKYPLAGYPNSSVELFAYNVDNRKAKKMDLPLDGMYISSFEFDGEGNNLMVMVMNRDQNHLQLFKVNPGSTVARQILEERSDAWLSPDAYQMVEYYAKSFVIGSERSGYRHLYEYDYNGNQLRQITRGDWNVTDYYGYDVRTATHFIQTTQRGPINRNVACVGAKGTVTMLNPEDGTESASFSRNFNYYVRKYSSAAVPPRYSICNNKGKVVKDLELNEVYAAKYASAPKMEFLKVKNAVGEEMDACIVKPSDFDPTKKYPLMMYQYNGPDSQLVLNSWSMSGTQYIASKGYVVAMVDGRGSGNRSRQWANCVYRDLGHYEVEDQLAGAAYFASLPFVDADRTSCFGWSYGGYMTLMELSDSKCKFKAGVAMAPVSDWHFYDSIYTERYMSTPQQNEKGYKSSSALLRSQLLKGRLLIMSGTSDDNVHFYNTLRYSSKVYSEGTVFDMLALPGYEHSLNSDNARVHLYNKIVDFLDNYVKK